MNIFKILLILLLSFMVRLDVFATECGSCQVMINGKCVWCYEIGQECRNDRCVGESSAESASNRFSTPSGLTIEILKQGMGPKPKSGQNVTVHFTGTLPNGKKFDSSRDRGNPFKFTLGTGQVIRGWDEGVALLPIGTQAKITIPPNLGYGASGAGGVIPPNSTLIFDIELLDAK